MPLRFALNHMTAPSASIEDFMALAARLGTSAVEIRNDLGGTAILDGTPAAAIKASAGRHGLAVASINALQRFNDWTAAREAEARELVAYARDCGAEAIVLVPVCDGTGREDGPRQRRLRDALTALMPLLADAGVAGLVEPLGFEISSLRSKGEAAEAIAGIGGGAVFRLVHDTFHHHLAGESAIFPTETGLVHISGVVDPALATRDMLDRHRVLVDAGDRLDNLGQIRDLKAAGYGGLCSFEPFAAAVQEDPNLEASLRASIDFIEAGS